MPSIDGPRYRLDFIDLALIRLMCIAGSAKMGAAQSELKRNGMGSPIKRSRDTRHSSPIQLPSSFAYPMMRTVFVYHLFMHGGSSFSSQDHALPEPMGQVEFETAAFAQKKTERCAFGTILTSLYNPGEKKECCAFSTILGKLLYWTSRILSNVSFSPMLHSPRGPLSTGYE